MSEAIRQHYVPRVYLKSFSQSKKKGIDRVYSLRKRKGEISLANIEDVAVERDFYTIKGEAPYIVEKMFSQIVEPLLADTLTTLKARCSNVLLQNNAKILDENLKADLVFSITFQLFRGKLFRNFEEEVYSQNMHFALEQAKHRLPQISSEKWDTIGRSFLDNKDYSKSLFLECSLNPERLTQCASVLFHRVFIVYVISGTMEFVTSDNPVMAIDSVSYDPTPFKHSLLQIPTTIYYPISPKILIASYHPSAYGGFLEKEDGKLKFLDTDENSNQLFIHTMNKKQYEQCFDQVYSKSKDILDELLQLVCYNSCNHVSIE